MVDYALAPLMFVEAPALFSGRAAGLFTKLAKPCNCFVEGTEVQTSEGLKPIEQIAVGDRVLARDDATGDTVFKPVVALIAGNEREIWEVTVETTDATGRVQREPIGTTDEHPWRTAAGAWLETKDLTPGTELVSADGDRAVVITVLKTDRIEPTYNFEVEGFHTYFVGESGVWVHNACERLLGNLLPRAGEIARTVARSRGASASNVRQMGPWADCTLQQVAEAAARGDRSAATALKIIKQAGRLGQRC
ncbi:MAG: Hint domain-containing protein [Brevundimonas sp.]|jgi:hypothetical protein|nr:Hint domain-containing protein [Brevundimonas sp.]